MTRGLLPILCFVVFLGCTKQDVVYIDAEEQLEADIVGAKSENDMQVFVSSSIDLVSISFSNTPENTNLVCRLNYRKLDECFNGMTIENLDSGDYIIQVTALTEDGDIAMFTASFFSFGRPYTRVYEVIDHSSEARVNLSLVNETFTNGQAVKTSEDLKFTFVIEIPNDCDTTLYCALDHRMAGKWHLCDTPSSKLVKAKQLAVGLQYLRVKAQCGDLSSPILNLYWYGVEDRYFDENDEPKILQISPRQNPINQLTSFSLAKANDCSSHKLEYECRPASQAAFRRCSNVHSQLPRGFAIRARCGEKTGPIWSQQ